LLKLQAYYPGHKQKKHRAKSREQRVEIFNPMLYAQCPLLIKKEGEEDGKEDFDR
jgi:hypothetical protein